MKRILFYILFFFSFLSSLHANHIKGGFFNYEYLGQGTGNNLRYRITLTVYMICNPTTGQLSNPINFSIFNARTGSLFKDESVPISGTYNLSKVYDEPCITGNETGCYYTIVVYTANSVELPESRDGYTIAYQRCCRIGGINNIINSSAVGNTFAITIPGTANATDFDKNSSPVFSINDTAVVCRNSFFEYSFEASDANGDSLAYQFCFGLAGASQNGPAPSTATSPPYSSVPYAAGYSGISPMGSSVTIDPITGLISGRSPDILGEFVICVCVSEYRAGVLIGVIRKELHIRVNDCSPLQAKLDPTLITCDGFTLDFANNTNNPANTEHIWTFGDPASGTNDTAYVPTPTHTYRDTGIYIVKLRVALPGGLCADSTTMRVGVYPGFIPNFEVDGGCFQNPYFFRDRTTTQYGFVDSWRWDFGDVSTLRDTSRAQFPQWTFPSPGVRTATLIVTNSKGCKDSTTLNFEVFDKPPLNLAFKDTLICIPDPVTLIANGRGVYSWTPPIDLVNANTATPTVNPTAPINRWYVVNIDDNGCINKDSVRVRVVDRVTLSARGDTTICRTDEVKLNAATDGLQYNWTSPDNTVLNPTNILNATVKPIQAITRYIVTARIGSCLASDDVVVTTVPYPVAIAGPPQTICYNTSTQLNGSHDGSTFSWSPAQYVSNANILNPIATPPRTTTFTLTSFDTKGCPKPGTGTVVVTVNPKVRAFAGRDTSVIVNQPLRFNASGGVNYVWTPSIRLSNPLIGNPVGLYTAQDDSIRYKVIVTDNIGCSDSAYVKVTIFKTKAYIFVPTAFTPNSDGLNDIVAPYSVGIKRINYFNIYNRWGQLVFTTTNDKQGWDGRINGRLQDTNVYAWMVSAVDYLDQPIFIKGTVTLLR
jgi:gliding motility-associated-like protein